MGGDAANESITLSQLGNRAGLVCDITDDFGGRLIYDYISRAGVDMSNVKMLPPQAESRPTHPSLILVQPDGQRRFMVMKSALSQMVERDFQYDESIVEDTRVLSFATIGVPPMAGEKGVQFIQSAATRAKRAGAVVCADIGYWQWHPNPIRYPEMFRLLDYIFPNQDEALSITGKNTVEDAADVFLTAGVGTVVIKVGAEGCYIKDQNGCVIHSPALMTDRCVDTTGAGDNFAAGFISAILDGENLEGCARFANATASIACSVYGANYGVTSKEQVLALCRRK